MKNKLSISLVRALLPLLFCLFCCLLSVPAAAGQGRPGQAAPRYVGSRACRPCHRAEYTSFIRYAKKSTSYRSIERLEKGLTREDIRKCYGCHTTGYGKPGGFVSVEKTPELKNAGCEVCHGPGSRHVRTGRPEDIKRRPTRKDCETCHTSERIRAFRYRPMIHGGGH
ncbi:multiheme c-type cytochrome [Thermodesulfobacteriota bacterium B35]